ncbi:hypothetical protein HDU91_004950, partial [Kappamyces sp. JEL0680]
MLGPSEQGSDMAATHNPTSAAVDYVDLVVGLVQASSVTLSENRPSTTSFPQPSAAAADINSFLRAQLRGKTSRHYSGLLTLETRTAAYALSNPSVLDPFDEFALSTHSFHEDDDEWGVETPRIDFPSYGVSVNKDADRLDLSLDLDASVAAFGLVSQPKAFKSTKRDKDLTQTTPRIPARLQTFTCSKCNKVLSSKASMQRHERVHAKSQFACSICSIP